MMTCNELLGICLENDSRKSKVKVNWRSMILGQVDAAVRLNYVPLLKDRNKHRYFTSI